MMKRTRITVIDINYDAPQATGAGSSSALYS
jgi:hypothetical protein